VVAMLDGIACAAPSAGITDMGTPWYARRRLVA